MLSYTTFFLKTRIMRLDQARCTEQICHAQFKYSNQHSFRSINKGAVIIQTKKWSHTIAAVLFVSH
jgi:hypothetical protein